MTCNSIDLLSLRIIDIDHSPRSVEQLEIRHEPIRVNADFDYSSIFEIKTTTSTHASQSYQASSSRAQSSHYSNQNANASSYYNGFQRNVDLYQSNYRFWEKEKESERTKFIKPSSFV